MKLNSKTICPTEVRDRIVDKWGPIDNGVNDMRLALETAEKQCFELAMDNEVLQEKINISGDIIKQLGLEKEGYKKIINEQS